MKIILQLLSLCLIISCATSTSVVSIPAKQTLTVATPDYELCEVELKNKSFKDVNVKVVKEDSGEFVRGFGLGMKAQEEVMVEQDAKLQLTNETDNVVRVGISFKERTARTYKNPKNTGSTEKTISFTLANTSLKPIPLIIPSVMNPNLSPRSESGVDLKMGQEIFFKAKGRKQILLVVDENIKKGAVIDAAKLLKERKRELGL